MLICRTRPTPTLVTILVPHQLVIIWLLAVLRTVLRQATDGLNVALLFPLFVQSSFQVTLAFPCPHIVYLVSFYIYAMSTLILVYVMPSHIEHRTAKCGLGSCTIDIQSIYCVFELMLLPAIHNATVLREF